MEWSIEAGDINIVEYLIRKGLNPSHIVEKSQQNSLHIAIAHHRVDVACFLLDLGVDYSVKDSTGRTPLQHHALTQDPELKHEIMSHPRINSCRFQSLCCCCCGSDPVPPLDNSNLTGVQSSHRQADLESGLEIIPTFRVNKDGTKRSYAVKRLSPTRLTYLMLYAGVTAGVWLLSMVIPFYAYIPLVGIGGGGYR
jgi:ankyrin repeat protein